MKGYDEDNNINARKQQINCFLQHVILCFHCLKLLYWFQDICLFSVVMLMITYCYHLDLTSFQLYTVCMASCILNYEIFPINETTTSCCKYEPQSQFKCLWLLGTTEK